MAINISLSTSLTAIKTSDNLSLWPFSNDRDEVYFVTQTLLSDGTVISHPRISPTPPQDYFPFHNGDSLNWVNLTSFSLDVGERAFTYVAILDQDNAEFELVYDFLAPLLIATGGIAAGIVKGDILSTLKGTVSFGKKIVETFQSLGPGDDLIGGFNVIHENIDGEIQTTWTRLYDNTRIDVPSYITSSSRHTADLTAAGLGNEAVYLATIHSTESIENNPTLYRGFEGDNEIYGSDFSDTIYGGEGSDYINGLNGNDSLFGEAGDDSLQGMADNDMLDGGVGNDVIEGGIGDDTLFGGEGNDSLAGGVGDDYIYGGEGNDVIIERIGDNTIIGGQGDDTIYGGAHRDVIYGGPNNDSIVGGGGSDLIHGGENQDKIYGGDGNDSISGDVGDDLLIGGPGNDTLEGDNGLDTVFGSDGDDVINGGDLDDYLSGEKDNDTLIGGSGNDVLRGGEGNDILISNDGSDLLEGGEGQDIFAINPNDSSFDVIYDFNQYQDKISFYSPGTKHGSFRFFDDGIYRFIDNPHYEVSRPPIGCVSCLMSSPGWIPVRESILPAIEIYWDEDLYDNDPGVLTAILLDAELDSLGRRGDQFGGYFQNLGMFFVRGHGDGRSQALTIEGSDYADLIEGNLFNNIINGLNGNDTILGAEGEDIMDGGAGDDDLFGEEGSDTLIGGPGSDIFNFGSISDGGVDLISDFDTEEDRISFRSGFDQNTPGFHRLADTTYQGVAGTGIYWDSDPSDADPGRLLGVLQGWNASQLSIGACLLRWGHPA